MKKIVKISQLVLEQLLKNNKDMTAKDLSEITGGCEKEIEGIINCWKDYGLIKITQDGYNIPEAQRWIMKKVYASYSKMLESG